MCIISGERNDVFHGKCINSQKVNKLKICRIDDEYAHLRNWLATLWDTVCARVAFLFFSNKETRRNCARSRTPRGLTRLRARLPRQFRKVREDVDLRGPVQRAHAVSRRRHLASCPLEITLNLSTGLRALDIPDDDYMTSLAVALKSRWLSRIVKLNAKLREENWIRQIEIIFISSDCEIKY